MNISVPLSRTLPPVNFTAWIGTCVDLANLLAVEPGLIALVGPKGSGKSYTLESFARAPSSPNRRASLRRPGQDVDPTIALDLVDGVDAVGLQRLDAEPPFNGQRVIAIRPDALEPLLRSHPNAHIIAVRPMSPRDVRTLMEARRDYFQLPADAFTLRALSALETFCGGNPETLDDLCTRAMQIARIANAPRIAAAHVEQAAGHLTMDPMERQPEPPRQNANRSADTLHTGSTAALAGDKATGGNGPSTEAAAPESATGESPIAPHHISHPPPCPKAGSGADLLAIQPARAAPQEKMGGGHREASSAWDLLARPQGAEAIARARRAKRNKAYRYVALATLAITLVIWTVNSGVIGRARHVAASTVVTLDRYIVRMDAPRAAYPYSRTEPEPKPETADAAVAPPIPDLPAAKAASADTTPVRGSSDRQPAEITSGLAPTAAPEAILDSGSRRDAAAYPADLAAAARLLAMVRTPALIGQKEDSRDMVDAAARTGNSEAVAGTDAAAPVPPEGTVPARKQPGLDRWGHRTQPAAPLP